MCCKKQSVMCESQSHSRSLIDNPRRSILPSSTVLVPRCEEENNPSSKSTSRDSELISEISESHFWTEYERSDEFTKFSYNDCECGEKSPSLKMNPRSQEAWVKGESY